MATRLFLRETTDNTAGYAATEQSTALPVGTSNQSGAVARDLKTTAGTSVTTGVLGSLAQTAHQDGFFRKWISPELAATSITAQTWTLGLAPSEGNNAGNAFTVCSIYVLKSDDTVRGFVYDSDTPLGVEWGVAARGQVLTVSGAAVSAVESTDRIVFEMWYHAEQAMAVSYGHDFSYNGTTEIVDGVNNSDPAAYIETPQDGLFAAGTFTGTAAPTQADDTSSASGTFEQLGFPTLAASTVSLETVDTTTHDVDMTGAASGLLAVLFISIDGVSTTLSNIPAGWTLAVDSTGQLSDFNGYVYWKRLTGADASFQYTSSNSEESVNRVWFIDDSSSDPEFAAVWSDVDSTTEDPPSLDPAGWGTEKTLWIAWTIRQGQAAVTAYPTDYTADQDTQRSSVNASAAADGIASRKLEAASENPGTFTWDTSNTGVGVTVAVRPTADVFTGSAAPTQEDDAPTASGTFTNPTLTGTAATTQADDTSTASGTFTPPVFTGSAAVTQADDTSAASGTFDEGTFTGSAAPTQADDTSTASGTFVNPTLTGTSAAVEEDDTGSATGTFSTDAIVGNAAVTQEDDTSAASGTFVPGPVTGTAAATQEDDIAAGTGSFTGLAFTGSGAVTAQDDTGAGSGTFVIPDVTGSAAAVQEDQTLVAVGTFAPLPPVAALRVEAAAGYRVGVEISGEVIEGG